ncbi:NUDIX hydrolase [Bacillus fungorum]|nr:NUDIX pyrophosphatase [Bacillus fungorum]
MSRQPKQVLVIPFIIDQGNMKFCILKREDMNWWQFVSGGAEFGESLAESALREVQEEIGISFLNNELMQLDTCCSVPKKYFKDNDKWNDLYVVTEHSFAIKLSNEEIRLSDEHTEFKWVAYDEAVELLQFDSNKTALWELKTRLEEVNNG